MKKITVELRNPYTCLIECGALAHAGSLVRKYVPEDGMAVMVTTATVRRHWGNPVENSLRQAGVRHQVLEMRDGERYKTMATVEDLAERLVGLGSDRSTVMVALGGGVVGDVTGFAAAVYMRGLDVLQLPTTLMAMIDSAIGGKTGVNLKAGKNLVGVFHQPRAVLIDPLALNSLPEREYRSGLSEAIKYGIIRSRELYAMLERRRQEVRRRDPGCLETMIAECVRMKAEVVAADERESDLRRILNFGHTFGHALESATEYRRFLHGEAVAWGMIAACRLAARLRRLSGEVARAISENILALTQPLPRIAVDAEKIWQNAGSDKKSRGGVLSFVLPREIGQVEVVRGVPEATVRETWQEIIEFSHEHGTE